MFFLPLEGRDLEYLFKLAVEKKGMSAERLARLAFLKGLRLLAKVGDEPLPVEGLIRGQQSLARKTIEEVHAYIRNNWQQQTDAQMSEVLGYATRYTAQLRVTMGLMRKRGRQPGVAKITASLPSPSRAQRREQLDALVREHWQTKDDAEIGRLVSPQVSITLVRTRRLALGLKKRGAGSVRKSALDTLIREHWQTKDDAEIGRLVRPTPFSRASVFNRRRELGLYRERGWRRTSSIREAINKEEFERMVLCEGYTMADYIRLKNLSCTRERLLQVLQELGIKHSPEDRAPAWELVRMARKVGNPNLANREWLAEKVAAHQSMAALASLLEIAEADLFFFIRRFTLTHPSFRKHGAITVELVCTHCHETFKRLKRWVDARRKRAKGTNGRELEFFCSTSCTGLHSRARAERRRQEELARKTVSEERATKRANQDAYIREHWQTMSDKHMGEALGLATKATGDRRYALGLKRKHVS